MKRKNLNYAFALFVLTFIAVTRAGAQHPNLAGVWYDYTAWTNNAGLVCRVEQNGDNLVFINNSNDRSKGNILSNTSVVATDWEGGLKATLENNGQRIVWKNGSVWERNLRVVKPNLAGVWYDYTAWTNNAGLVCHIEQDGDKLVFINNSNDRSKGNMLSNTSVVATDWEGGLKAALENNGQRIVWKNGSVWERNLRVVKPNLAGVWYDYTAWTNNAGLVCHIEQDGDKLVFINNSNDRSKGNMLSNTSVVATDWEGGLKATLENNGQRIVWKNGSVWERNLRVVKPNLAGVWYDYTAWTNNAGLVCHIEQDGDKLVFINNSNDRSKGNMLSNTSVVATGWEGGLKAALENNGQRIVWKNGSVWERNLRVVKPNLAGVWYDYTASSNNAGLVCHIEQDGDKLVFINNSNDRSKGNMLSNTSVVATDWEGGLKATLENNGQRIVWKNGSVWERNLRVVKPNLAGVWYDYTAWSNNAGLVCRVEQDGDKLVFINNSNDRSKGNIIDNTSVVATDWEGGLKAALENNAQRIVWSNGSVWERNLRVVKPNLAGVWYDYTAWSNNAGLVCRIEQDGDKLVFINNSNDRSKGNIIDNTSVVATDWEGGLKATLENNAQRIVWKNGSVWERNKR